MKRASRIGEAWPRGGAVVPQWFFWLVLVAVALLCGLAIGYLGNPGATISDTSENASDASPVAESDQPAAALPSEEAEDAAEQTIGDAPTGGSSELITDGVTIQVLNASGRGKTDNKVADQLRSLDFDIFAVNPAAKIYQRTTVFWSKPSGRDAAQALAEHFDWKSAPRPKNLSKSVTIHVVVGRDEI